MTDTTPAGGGSGDGTVITVDQCARLLMLGPTRVRQLIAQGYIPKTKQGVVPLVGSVQGYIKFLRSEDRQSSKQAAAGRVQDARTTEIQLRVAERQRELIPVDDAREYMAELAAFTVSCLQGISLRATRDLVMRAAIDKEIELARTRIAERMETLGRTLRTGRADPAPGSEDAP